MKLKEIIFEGAQDNLTVAGIIQPAGRYGLVILRPDGTWNCVPKYVIEIRCGMNHAQIERWARRQYRKAKARHLRCN